MKKGDVAKLIIGALFFFSCIGTDMEIGARLLGIVLGLALIAWAILPRLLPKYLAKKKENEDLERRKAAAAAAEEKRLNTPWQCRSCGAMTKGDVCEYCGTPRS